MGVSKQVHKVLLSLIASKERRINLSSWLSVFDLESKKEKDVPSFAL